MSPKLFSILIVLSANLATVDWSSAAENNFVPAKFSASIGGFLGTTHSVHLTNNTLLYQVRKGSNTTQSQVTPTADQWREFRRTLDELKAWRWQTNYPNPRVYDGTHWSLEIAYSDHALRAEGSNSYPEESGKPNGKPEATKAFDRYLAAVEKLLGGKRFK